MILDTIIASTKVRVEKAKETLPPSELIKKVEKTDLEEPHFKSGLVSPNRVSIIAEIKKASPSKGLIRPDFDHVEIAKEYAACGADALSVLTEPEFFKGDIKFIGDIKSIFSVPTDNFSVPADNFSVPTDSFSVPAGTFSVPILRKDFVVDEYQIYEAKLYGADAVLLIMAALTDAEYKKFHALADDLKLDVLVETHNADEVKRAVEYGGIIGVNNRNLYTFEEDITTCEKLLPLIPEGKVKVAESAIRTHGDFKYLESLGFDAALIGEAFMRERDIKRAVNRLRYGD